MKNPARLLGEYGSLSVVTGRWFASERQEQREQALDELDAIGPWARTIVRGDFILWHRLPAVIRALLEGKAIRQVARETGCCRHAVSRMARKLVLVKGLRCACGRPVRHTGTCRNRLSFHPVRRRRFCKYGHVLSAENTYGYSWGSQRYCKRCAKRRSAEASKLKAEWRWAGKYAEVIRILGGDASAFHIVRTFRKPVEMARAAVELSKGKSGALVTRQTGLSRCAIWKLQRKLEEAGRRCPCGKRLAHYTTCPIRATHLRDEGVSRDPRSALSVPVLAPAGSEKAVPICV